MNSKTNAPGLSGFTLKMIAVVTMTIDHMAAVIGERAIFHTSGIIPYIDRHLEAFQELYMAMRVIGRMAFPLYCFLLVEGFKHTRNVWKYAGNLLIFALISEVPFDTALFFSQLEFRHNNVMWTLLLGLLMMIASRFIHQKIKIDTERPAKKYMLCFFKATCYTIITLTAMALAQYVFCTDYGASGIAAIAAIYFLREHPLWGYALAIILLSLMSGRIELYAMVTLIAIYFYNGTKGYQNRTLKYVFYWIYPVHLFLITVLCHYMGLPIYIMV